MIPAFNDIPTTAYVNASDRDEADDANSVGVMGLWISFFIKHFNKLWSFEMGGCVCELKAFNFMQPSI